MEENNSLQQFTNALDDESGDEVPLDASFFLNENYQLQNFAVESETIELYCLQSSLTDFDLTGQLVWPGAELLAEYLLQQKEKLEGSAVIELGAGLGLAGLICARLCDRVVITDYNDTVLKVLQMNRDHQISTRGLSSFKVELHKLDWSIKEHLAGILEQHPLGFDLVIGADICYQQSCLPHLFGTIETLLKRSSGAPVIAYLGYVSRWTSMDAAVCLEASKVNLDIKEVPGTRKSVNNLYEGWIYELSLRS